MPKIYYDFSWAWTPIFWTKPSDLTILRERFRILSIHRPFDIFAALNIVTQIAIIFIVQHKAVVSLE